MVHNSHAIMVFVLARNAENSLSMGTYVSNALETGIKAKEKGTIALELL